MDSGNKAQRNEPQEPQDIGAELRALLRERQPEGGDAGDAESAAQFVELLGYAMRKRVDTVQELMENALEAISLMAAEGKRLAIKRIKAFAASEAWDRIKAHYTDAPQWLKAAQEHNLIFTSELTFSFIQAVPEMEQWAKEHGTNATLGALISWDEFEKCKIDPGGDFRKLIDASKKRTGADPEKGQPDAAADELTKIPRAVSALNKIFFPLDKVNANIWRQTADDIGGTLCIAAEGADEKRELNILYSLVFEQPNKSGLTISENLDAFDKRAYVAAASLYDSKGSVMTLGQIWAAMGNTGNITPKERERLKSSLGKMEAAIITLDNTQEARAYKYPRVIYRGRLLPLVYTAAELPNGSTVEAVRLLDPPPLVEFAKNRHQVTAIPLKILQTPLRMTRRTLALEDYLLQRISRAKTAKGQQKILFETIYKNTGAETKKQRQDCRKKITQLLAAYTERGFIKSYSESADGIHVEA